MAFFLPGREGESWTQGYLSHQMPYVIWSMTYEDPFEIRLMVLGGGERLSMLLDESGKDHEPCRFEAA